MFHSLSNRLQVRTMLCLLIVLAFLCLTESQCIVHGNHTEVLLHKHLLMDSDYSEWARPVNDFFSSVQVNSSLDLITIHSVDEKMQVFKATVWTTLEWFDAHLTWDPCQYGGADAVLAPLDKIWSPDVCFSNDLSDNKCMNTKDREKVMLHSYGKVKWWFTKEIHSSCGIDISKYPFDRQKCSIKLGLRYSTDEKVKLNSPIDYVSTNNFETNEEWELLNTHVVYKKLKVERNFTEVVHLFILQRRSAFYVYHIILPIVLLALLNVLCFVLPIESGEKIGMAMAIFLTYAVFMTLVSETVPKSSEHVFGLGIYMSIELLMSGLTIAIEVYVLSIYHRQKSRPMTKIYRFVLRCLDHRCNVSDGIKAPNGMYHATVSRVGSSSMRSIKTSSEPDDKDLVVPFTKSKDSQNDWQRLAKCLDKIFGLCITIVNALALIVYLIAVHVKVKPHS